MSEVPLCARPASASSTIQLDSNQVFVPVDVQLDSNQVFLLTDVQLDSNQAFLFVDCQAKY